MKKGGMMGRLKKAAAAVEIMRIGMVTAGAMIPNPLISPWKREIVLDL
ncbi:MAG: hypothetical protein JXA18_14760 [Chitinispirillaceae bacterium]|nr:hypothetical protein [Chitinispirillaceae bacterium]